MIDHYRPRKDPARLVYDALVAESAKREGRSCYQWIRSERQAMLDAACDYANQHGLRAPTMKDIAEAERLGIGHTDYASKVAYAVQAILRKKSQFGYRTLTKPRTSHPNRENNHD